MTRLPSQTAIGVAAAIETADDAAAVQAALRVFAGSFGYDRFVLFSASAARDEVLDRIYWVEGDWFGDGDAVDAETYIGRCPVNRHIVEVHEPFFWTKTTKGSDELYRLVRAPRGRGVHGLQIPVFGPSKVRSASVANGLMCRRKRGSRSPWSAEQPSRRRGAFSIRKQRRPSRLSPAASAKFWPGSLLAVVRRDRGDARLLTDAYDTQPRGEFGSASPW